jgi:hypothetical protein
MSGITLRYDPDEANSTHIGSRGVHNIESACKTCYKCHKEFGIIGCALLAISTVAIGYAAYYVFGPSSGDDFNTLEVCHYNAEGDGCCYADVIGQLICSIFN